MSFQQHSKLLFFGKFKFSLFCFDLELISDFFN